MALAATEVWRGGFVIDTTTGQVATTTSKAGATWQGGFLRDPDGRLVVTYG
jgi:hypothetical protein